MKTPGRKLLAATLLVAIVSLASELGAAPVNLPQAFFGGENSGWDVSRSNTLLTPTRFMVREAENLLSSFYFDGGLTFRIGSTWYDTPDPVEVDGPQTTISGNVVSIAGLNVSAQYQFDQNLAIVRQIVTLTNPTGSTINTPGTLETNLASNTNTLIDGSSSGDALFDTSDRWLVTSTNMRPYSAIRHILYGPDTPALTTSAVSMTVSLNESGTEGVLAAYDLSLAAGETQRLMFFAQLTDPGATSVSGATFWDDFDNVLNAGLVDDLSPEELASIVNWFAASESNPNSNPALPEPSSLVLLGLGALGLARAAARRRRAMLSA